MKKESVLVFCILISLLISISFISAEFKCSDGSGLNVDSKEIERGKSKNINGLGIGLINSDESVVMNRFSADVVINSIRVSMTNESSQIFEISGEEHNITIINGTSEGIGISIDGDNGAIAEKSDSTVSGFKVFLIEHSKTDSLISGVFLIGSKQVSLSNDNNPNEIVNVEGVDYGIGLFSASDSNVIIEVSKCNSGTLEKVVDIIPEVNETIVNNTLINSSVVNDTAVNETDNSVLNNSNSINNEDDSSGEWDISNFNDWYYYIIGGIVLVIILVLFFLARSFRKKREIKNQ